MPKSFLYLIPIMDWHSRAVLAWQLSNTLGADFCVEALDEVMERYSRLEIFNTDQGCQFTSIQALRQLYEKSLSICGRSALPTGCASPASRASSESREMLAFAHIPTGTTASRKIDQKGFEDSMTSAATAIGADIEICRATP